MIVLPVPLPAVATPRALMDATSGAEDVHVTMVVTVAVELSLTIAVAVNPSVVPGAIEAEVGETEMELSVTVLEMVTVAVCPGETVVAGVENPRMLPLLSSTSATT